MKKNKANDTDWDNWWSIKFSQNSFLYKLWHYFLWRAYERLLSSIDLKRGCRVLELGSGSGRISLQMAQKYGCEVTLIDNSRSAIEQAKRHFKDCGIEARFIHSDLLDINIKEEYDLVHSEGLIEHFSPDVMNQVMLVHTNAVHKGGYVITFAPTPSTVYGITTWLMKATKNWYFGYEVPISLSDHTALYERTGLQVLKYTNVLFREAGLIGEK